MRITPKHFYTSFLFLLAACASSPQAPTTAGADPQMEVNRASGMIEEAASKQYDRLAPKTFAKAVDHRNAAAENLREGKSAEAVLKEAAAAQFEAQQVKSIGDAQSANVRGALEARRHAVAAQAPKFQAKDFRSADDDLADIGHSFEKGNYKVDADDLLDIEKKFGRAEIAARKHGEIGNAKLMIERAEKNGAKSKTPSLYEIAQARYSSAGQAIELSPHSGEGYAAAVAESNRSALKLEEVLAIASRDNASESAALTIWTQNHQLAEEKAALAQTKIDAERRLSQSKSASEAELAQAQAAADEEKERLEGDLAAKNAAIAAQGSAISNLQSENSDYASAEELKQKIEEARKKFSSDEAEVMKDGNKIVVRLKKMQFPSGRSDLNPESFATLRKVDDLISSVPAEKITVEGHTDSIGSDSTNRSLSEKRAESVKKYLTSQSAMEELKVETQGYGSDRPITTNKTKEGRAMNRRVDIVIDTPNLL